jgi:hypothetical protein
MIKSIVHIHQHFHWIYHTKNKKLLFSIGSGISIWLFLALTQPFGIYNSNISDLQLFLALMPVGILWALVILIADLICIRLLKIAIQREYKTDLLIWGAFLILILSKHLVHRIEILIE